MDNFEKTSRLHNDYHAKNILSSLFQLYEHQIMIDICIEYQGFQFFAHKVVIAAASPLFRERMKESIDGCTKLKLEDEIYGDSLIEDDVKLLIEFIYKGQVTVPSERYKVFLKIANHFKILGLQDYLNTTNIEQDCLSNFPLHTPTFSYVGAQNQSSIDLDDSPSNLENGFNIYEGSNIYNPLSLNDSLIKTDKCLPHLFSSPSYMNPYGGPLLNTINDTDSRCFNNIPENSKRVELFNFVTENVQEPNYEPVFNNKPIEFKSFDYLPESDIFMHNDSQYISNSGPSDIGTCDRQLRLKVKDSIGGVSLQDTTQTEKETDLFYSESNDSFEQQIEGTVHINECTEDEVPVFHLSKCASCSTITAMGVTHVCPPNEADQTSTQCKEKVIAFIPVESSDPLTNSLSEELIDEPAALKTKSDRVQIFKCNDCSAQYRQRYNLLRHNESAHRINGKGEAITSPFKCDLCPFEAWARHKVDNHKVRCHSENKKFQCLKCSYASTEKNSLQKHQRTHTGERPFKCESCEKTFVTVSVLRRHERVHTGVKPFACDQCDLRYADRKRLRDHLLKHSDSRPFKCTSCEYAARRKDNLQSHIKRNHSDILNAVEKGS